MKLHYRPGYGQNRGREGRKDKSERKKSEKGESEDGVEEGQRQRKMTKGFKKRDFPKVAVWGFLEV